MPDLIEYPYMLNKKAAGIVTFIFCTFFLLSVGLLITCIAGVINPDLANRSPFSWMVWYQGAEFLTGQAVFAGIFVFFIARPATEMFITLVASFFKNPVLRLTETEFHAPNKTLTGEVVIPFHEIEGIKQGRRGFAVRSKNKTVRILKSELPPGAFEEVCKTLIERTKQSRAVSL